jgi:heme oxygenase
MQIVKLREDSALIEFKDAVQTCVEQFKTNRIFRKVDNSQVVFTDYHNMLLMLFHQVLSSSSTFSLAAAHMSQFRTLAREYLMKHADEEKSHWSWILNDLRSTGYSGPDPRSTFPSEACQAYISFNFHMATRMPITRLAIATVLESIGATYGKDYASKICKQLKLTAPQASFFFGHGDTDVGHTRELLEVINSCQLTPDEWKWMAYAAETAYKMYYRMYDDVGA